MKYKPTGGLSMVKKSIVEQQPFEEDGSRANKVLFKKVKEKSAKQIDRK